jgi:four helix bundle protein
MGGHDSAGKRGGPSQQFDLTERTARFGENAIRLARSMTLDPITSPLATQLVRASTSIGANHGEADESGSKKEFRYRISLCTREARETKHWLRMIVKAIPDLKDEARLLWKEADALTRIFAAIHRNSKPPSKE